MDTHASGRFVWIWLCSFNSSFNLTSVSSQQKIREMALQFFLIFNMKYRRTNWEKWQNLCRFFKKSLDRLGGPKNVVCGAFTKSVHMCTRFTCIRTCICIHMYSYVYHSCVRYYLDMKVLKVFKLPEKGTCLQKICFLRYGPKTSRLIRMQEF